MYDTLIMYNSVLSRSLFQHFGLIWRRKLSNISYVHNVGDEPLRPLNLGQLLERTCVDYGDTTAVVSCHQGAKKTYAEVLYEADCLAAGLAKMGFSQGDRIGIWAPNQIEWYTSYLGCARAGLLVGTTGSPKAAIISHFSTVNNGYYAGKRAELHKRHHKICLQNPLFHAYGTVVSVSASINHGSTLVLPSDGFDSEKSINALRDEGCTIIYGTPTMYVDLIDIQKKRRETLNVEIALTGGASCSPQLFEDMLKVLNVKKVKSVYGMSETTASSFQSLEHDDKIKATTTVGYLQEHLEAKIVDKEGNIVPIGVPGELCIRGYSTMLGYYREESKTKETLHADGWLHTGDQFLFTEDRYGRILGRYQEMIIRGGENIYPKEIEDFLNTHPDILEAQVIGLPNERLGDEVCAVLRTVDSREITVGELRDFCEGEIARFKVPTKIYIVEAFPTTTSGKIQKHKLLQTILNKMDAR